MPDAATMKYEFFVHFYVCCPHLYDRCDLCGLLKQGDRIMRKELHETNRIAWNEATKAHNSHKLDQARFFREGGSTLFPDEIELLGDVSGRALLHLQCNAGQDTLSMARLGATVTGVDISDEAIAFARQLSADSGIPATFHRADVYDWLQEQPGAQFDVVFSSYGALVWLSDLRAWARGIAHVLRPGGRVTLLDFHPVLSMLGDDWRIEYPYSTHGQPLTFEEGIGDYVAMSGAALAPSGYLEGVQNFRNPHASHEFAWAMSDIIMALLDAGLALKTFREYPYSNGATLREGMRDIGGNRFVPPADLPEMPLMFSIVAHRELT
jgi:SAM-dependent methyltransferase